MFNTTEQFASINKTNVGQAAKLAAFAFERAEKLASINLLTAKNAIAQGVEGAQAVAGLSDVQQFFPLNARLAEAGVQAALGYSKTLYALATETQAGYTALVEDTVATYTKGATAWVDEASKSAPAGSEPAVAAFRQGLAASTAAFDRFNHASKQMANFVDASVRAAADKATAVATTKGRKSA
jgi:phasin family protein